LYRVEAVYLSRSGKADIPIDLSKDALCHGPYTKLACIHEKVVRLIAVGSPAKLPDKSGDRCEMEEVSSNEQEVFDVVEGSRRVRKEEAF